MIKVLLLKSFQNLGVIGDIVTVKPGYAKNFLIPSKVAIFANDKVIKMFEENKAELKKADDNNYSIADTIKTSILSSVSEGSKFSVLIHKKTFNDGKLYGSVSSKEICEALISLIQNIPSLKSINIKEFISPDKVKLMKNIKYEGQYDAKLAIYSTVSVDFEVNVVKE